VIYSPKLKKTNGFILMVQSKFVHHSLSESIKLEESSEIWKFKPLNSLPEMFMHSRSLMINLLSLKNV